MTILVRQIRLRCFTLLKILPINFAFAWNKRQRYSDFKFRSSVTRRLSQKPGFRTTHTRPYHHMRIKSFSCLPPATKLRQGNVFTPVCHSVHRGGLPHTYPWADKPPGQTPPSLPGQCMLGYGQQAGGTHPTGMQSCNTDFHKYSGLLLLQQ